MHKYFTTKNLLIAGGVVVGLAIVTGAAGQAAQNVSTGAQNAESEIGTGVAHGAADGLIILAAALALSL